MKKKCKRKVTPLNYNLIGYAISGARVTAPDVLDQIRLRELVSLDAMSKGMGTTASWGHLVEMVNLAQQFAKEGIGREALEVCMVAQDALLEAAKRYETTKKMGLSGIGIQALRDVHEYHDLQRQAVSRSDYERLIHKMMLNTRSKGPDVVEV